MKKIGIIITVLLIALSLMACQDNNIENENVEKNVENENNVDNNGQNDNEENATENEKENENVVKNDNNELEEKSPVTYKMAALNGPTAISCVKLLNETYVKENVSLTVDVVPTPDLLLPKLLSNEYDFAQIPTNLAAIIYNKGAKYQIDAVTLFGVMYVITTDETISSYEDFRGKTISTLGQGTTPDIVFNYIMKQKGLESDEYTLDYSIPKTELAKAVISENVKVAALPEPFVTMTKLKNDKVNIVMDMQEEWENITGVRLPQTGVVSNMSIPNEDREIVLNAILESTEFALSNKEETAKMIGELESVTLTEGAVLNSIDRLNLEFSPTKESKSILEKYFEILFEYDNKSIGGQMPDDEIYSK